jgi:hypothetical protein
VANMKEAIRITVKETIKKKQDGRRTEKSMESHN